MRVLLLVFLFSACAPCGPWARSEAPAAPQPRAAVTISIVGTNDFHGALDRLPIFAGYLNNLRAVRQVDGGVVLVDAGDMFQGTLESNLNEGAAVIDAYNALGYTAAAIGNHEFDFGPVGPRATPEDPDDDPRGALKERLAQARFPLLVANLAEIRRRSRVDWPNAPASIMHEVAGVRVGIIGVTTKDTLSSTMAANVVGLVVAPLAPIIERNAEALRQAGADIVVVAAHAGGACTDFSDPDDLSSCRMDEEIMEVARALPPGLVDVIVAGHTHQGMAHRVNGIVIIESYARGRAFGRVDITLSPGAAVPGEAAPGAPAEITTVRVFPPQDLCPGPERVAAKDCQPGAYEGRPVTPDPRLAEVIAGPMDAARALKETRLGVELEAPITRSYAEESALGNLFADLMREARPADVALTNGGGLRADLPAGALTYGALHEAAPFDNRLAMLRLSAGELAHILAANLQSRDGILSVSGVRVIAACRDGALAVELRRDGGEPIAGDETLVVATSDFLAAGGSNFYGELRPDADAVTVHGDIVRDLMADVLRARGGSLSRQDPRLLDPAAPRLRYPGPRPVQCPRAQ